MRNFKLLILCVFLGISIGHAQQRKAGGMRDSDPTARAKNNMERLHKELDLSKSQQDSIYTYLLQRANRHSEQASKSKEAAAGQKMDMQHMREEYNAKIKSFLTKEQLEKFNAMADNTRKTQRRR